MGPGDGKQFSFSTIYHEILVVRRPSVHHSIVQYPIAVVPAVVIGLVEFSAPSKNPRRRVHRFAAVAVCGQRNTRFI